MRLFRKYIIVGWLRRFIIEYNQLQLIQNINNYSVGNFYGVILVVTSFTLFGGFGLISFYHALEPAAMLVILCCLISGTVLSACYFYLASRVTELSEEFLVKVPRMRGNTKSGLLWNAKMRAFHPLRVHVGIFFYANRNSGRRYHDIVISTVINLVLSFGS